MSDLLGTLYKAMSGLNAFTKGLDNLSNNVANLNTTGYKANDVFYRELTGGNDSGNSDDTGSQIQTGQGVEVGGTKVRFADGELAETGEDTDLAISGNGLFILRDGEDEYYTRAGEFELDSDGYLVDPGTGLRVAKLDDDGNLQDINLRDRLISEAQASTEVLFRGTLNLSAAEGTQFPPSTASETDLIEFTVYDENGNDFKVFATFTKLAGRAYRVDLADENGNPLADSVTVEFTENGAPTKDTIRQIVSLSFFEQVPVDDVAKQFEGVEKISIENDEGDPEAFGEITIELDESEFITRSEDDASEQTFSSKVIFEVDADGRLVDADSGQVLMARNADDPDELIPAQIALEASAAATTSITLQGQLSTLSTEPAATEVLVLSGELRSDDPVGTTYPDNTGDEPATVTAEIIDAEGNAYSVTVTLVKVVSEAERLEYEVVFDQGLPTEFKADENVVYLLEAPEGDGVTGQWVLDKNEINAQFAREIAEGESQVTVDFVLDLAGNEELPALQISDNAGNTFSATQLGGIEVESQAIYPPFIEDDEGNLIQENPLSVTLFDEAGNEYEVTVTYVRVVNESDRIEFEVVFNYGEDDEFKANSNLVYTRTDGESPRPNPPESIPGSDVDGPAGIDDEFPGVGDQSSDWELQDDPLSAVYEGSRDGTDFLIRFDLDANGVGDELGLVLVEGASGNLSVEQVDGKPTGDIIALEIDPTGKVIAHYANGDVIDDITLAVVNRNVEELAVDFSAVNGLQFTSSRMSVEDVDGRPTGQLVSYRFDTDGTLVLEYSNEDEVKDGRVALAIFSNVSDLQRSGDALFTADEGADRVIGSGEDGAFGSIIHRSIERSNVELSREFAEIIIVQRGFQAASQVLNATNELIEELYNSSRGGR